MPVYGFSKELFIKKEENMHKEIQLELFYQKISGYWKYWYDIYDYLYRKELK